MSKVHSQKCSKPKLAPVSKVYEGDLIVYNKSNNSFLVHEIFRNDINQFVFHDVNECSSAYSEHDSVMICDCGMCR